MLNYTLVRFHGSRVPVLNKLVKIESHDVANNDDIRQLVQLYRTRSSASADGAPNSKKMLLFITSNLIIRALSIKCRRRRKKINCTVWLEIAR